MVLGVHVSGFGSIYNAPALAHRLGCNTMQIFSRSPQRWRGSSLDESDIEEFKKARDKYKIKPVFIHAPYLINLASAKRMLYRGSIKAYIQDIKEAEALGADYIVTHMGSHNNTSEKEGLSRLKVALGVILEKTQGSSVGILLENTAGAGSWLGYKFEHQAEVMSGLGFNPRLGLCLDTAHAYLAGYDLATQEGLDAILKEIDRLIGVKYIKLIHLNDAFAGLGSHRDRHEHIGKGGIGAAGIRRIVRHPLLKTRPFILETPKDNDNSDKINLAAVRRLAR